MHHVSHETEAKLAHFTQLLTRWNEKINLVSPKDIAHLRQRHIEDSLQLVPYVPEGARITDLGSGGGFPGLIVAIATGNPVTLIESDQRKCAFLREAARECGARVSVLAKRIEQAVLEPADIITARALAPLPQLLTWARPLLKEDGYCLFLKGRKTPDELTKARSDWHMLYNSFPSHTDPDGVLLKISDFRRV
ncbi:MULTISPECIES: 16S rRNA (guanine(527)-N(7))-methyltransferase RsmG [Bombella]|uniref:Ribosomal RNA small subunit methyltransferase G n=1 Tax=Bombella pollinis TaxID=2967337 RepID=A0ABT3WJ41_9PROT|nr:MULTISPECIES: 16S rRNA (guanine(527)-N(7))-methyltransferase RsmG [Bombella]MCX5619130.1 16S rRNA (guanine(527)-N(7))-methyltransferase RsmG [Bombella pollinis]MUG05490.1 16S rRNA (guanine(527)-N(7))-methyltransferase RsmG [Bombella sp. ESL0378]MUG89347.1 16S rRNA (guanine(527)-N(7))-methyltransferase RsmG [Bombella sp. ESL0385]